MSLMYWKNSPSTSEKERTFSATAPPPSLRGSSRRSCRLGAFGAGPCGPRGVAIRRTGATTEAERTDERGKGGRDERDEQGDVVAVKQGLGGAAIARGRDVDGGDRGQAEGGAELEGGVEEASREALLLLVDAVGGDDGERAVGEGER